MGALDAAMASVAASLVNAFVTTPITVTRTVASFNVVTDVTGSPTITTFSMVAAPPSPYFEDELQGRKENGRTGYASNALFTDLKMLVPTANFPTGFGAFNSKTDTVTFKGVVYTIMRIDQVYSGDSAAAVELMLRA